MNLQKKAKQYAKTKSDSKFLVNAHETGYLDGYSQAIKDSKINESVKALKSTISACREIGVLDRHCDYLEELINHQEKI